MYSKRTRRFCLAALSFFVSLCTRQEAGVESDSDSSGQDEDAGVGAVSSGALSFVRGAENVLDAAAQALCAGQDSEDSLHLYDFCTKLLEDLTALEVDAACLRDLGTKVKTWHAAKKAKVQCRKVLTLALLPKLSALLEASERGASASPAAARLRAGVAAAMRVGVAVLFP